MAKNVQIPEQLFLQICKYHLLGDDTQELQQKISIGLSEKLDAICRRTLYTQYKTAPTEQERDEARQRYLAEIGLNADFRW